VSTYLYSADLCSIVFDMLWYMISISEYITENKDNNTYSCSSCHVKHADIFQVEGDYCLECWQKRTCPNI